jgi:predicted regulator of Ras-like GTPase activity (Roadblock/LC7/MglB family)
MEQQLLALLNYADVLGAVASTQDGLVVASAGLNDLDAETVAAAGSALVNGAGGSDPALAIDLDGGSLFLTRGEELMLVVLAEASVAQDPLANVMIESVAMLDSQLAGNGG